MTSTPTCPRPSSQSASPSSSRENTVGNSLPPFSGLSNDSGTSTGFLIWTSSTSRYSNGRQGNPFVQVWGMSCFEPVANAVVDHLPSLKRLSIITLPVSKEMFVPSSFFLLFLFARSSIKELIGHVAKSSPHLVEFGLSSEMIALLISEEDKSEPTSSN